MIFPVHTIQKPIVGSLPAVGINIGWREAQSFIEKRLAGYLEIPEDYGVLYLNRATSGFDVLLKTLSLTRSDIVLGENNFWAIERLAHNYFDCIRDYTSALHTSPVIVSVSFGGADPDIHNFNWDLMRINKAVMVFDCAHCCRKGLFSSLAKEHDFKEDEYYIFSFQSTKAQGSPAGGGALVCHKDKLDQLRYLSMPRMGFYNPRTAQCYSTVRTLEFENQKRLEKFYSKNREIHIQLAMILSRYFIVVSDITMDLTPTMCVLRQITPEACDKLYECAENKFEIREAYGGLLCIPTYTQAVVDIVKTAFA